VNEHFDILVVGAGPAGIAAAVSASASGKRVGLVDDNPAPGGQIWRSGTPAGAEARKWLARLDTSSVFRLQGWRVIDHPKHGTLRVESDQDCRDLCYEKLILATGARERFLPFPGWTIPNVMGAGGLDAMVRGGLPIAGKRVVVGGTGPLLLAVAAHLTRRGAKIVAVCEQAPLRRFVPFAAYLLREPAKLLQGIAFVPSIVTGIEGLFASRSGVEKKNAAMSFVSAALQLTDAVTSRHIVDPEKFKQGLSAVIDGTVLCLNASTWAKPTQP